MDPLVSTDWLAAELGARGPAHPRRHHLPPRHRPRRPRRICSRPHPRRPLLRSCRRLRPGQPAPRMAGRPPISSPAGCARSASATTTASSSTTTARSTPPPAPGTCSAGFGARQVALLDGGLQKWLAEGRPTESGAPAPRPGHFTPQPVDAAMVDKAQVLALLGGDTVIADARAADRFRGRRRRAAPRPRRRPHPRRPQPPAERLLPRRQQLQTRRRAPRPLRRSRRRPREAARHHLRLGRHRLRDPVRRAPARQNRPQPL